MKWLCILCWRSGSADSERHARQSHGWAIEADNNSLRTPFNQDVKGSTPGPAKDGFIPFTAPDCKGDLRFGPEAEKMKRPRFQKQAERLFDQ